MIRFTKKTDEDKNITVTGKRFSSKKPVYMGDEVFNLFINDVFAYVDDVALTALKKHMESEDYEYDEVTEGKFEILNGNALSKAGHCTQAIRTNPVIKAFAISLGWVKPDKCFTEFSTIYDKAIAYQVKYIGKNTWGQERKDEFTEVRNLMIDVFMKRYSAYIKEGFNLKISSKEVEGFLNTLYHVANKDNKQKYVTVSKWVKMKMLDAFIEYLKVINTVTGLTEDEGETIFM